MPDKNKWPAYLYYGDDNNSENYSNVPSGEFDIDKLIEGNDKCWLQNKSTTAKNKKIIILNYAALSTDNVDLVQQINSDGFEVYYVNRDGGLSIHETDKQDITIKKQHDLLKMEELKGTAIDNLYILNDRNISRLRSDLGIGSVSDINTIDIAGLPGSVSEIEHILNNLPLNMKFVAYENSNKEQDLRLAILSRYNIKFDVDIRNLRITSMNELEEVLQNKNIQFDSIKKIYFDAHQIPLEKISLLFNKVSNLEEIISINNKYKTYTKEASNIDLNIDQLALSKLKKLSLNGIKISPKQLYQLINNKQSLKEIDLGGTIISTQENNPDNNLLDTVSLDNIDNLIINHRCLDIPNAQTDHLYIYFPNLSSKRKRTSRSNFLANYKLKTIAEQTCTIDNSTAKPTSLTTDLSLRNINTTFDEFSQILKNSQFLNRIYLEKVTIADDNSVLDGSITNNLTDLSLCSVNGSSKTISKIFKISPKLKNISIFGMAIGDEKFDFKKETLNNLRSLSIGNTDISYNHLYQLLKQSSGLEKILLSNVRLHPPGNIELFNDLKLPNLSAVHAVPMEDLKLVQKIIDSGELTLKTEVQKLNENITKFAPLQYLSSDINSTAVDFDTKNNASEKAYEIQYLFTSWPDIKIENDECRLACYSEIETRNDSLDPIKISMHTTTRNNTTEFINDIFSNAEELEDIYKKNGERYFKCKMPVKFNNNITYGVALPALSTNDDLKRICITDNNGNLLDKSDFEIRYSYLNSQYVLFSKKANTKVNISFLIEPAEVQLFKDRKSFFTNFDNIKNKDIFNILQKYATFKIGELVLPKEKDRSDKNIGETYMNALANGGVGSCRHRARGALYEIKKKFPGEQIRVGQSTNHNWIEIKQDDQWLKLDLGGYPDVFKAQEQEQIISSNNFSPFDVWNTNEKENKDITEFTDLALDRKYKNTLIEFNSKTELDQYRKYLLDNLAKKKASYYYVNSPNELSISKPCAKLKDNILEIHSKSEGDLFKFITNKTNARKVLIVNWNNFKAEDIVKFNTALDIDAKIDGVPINKNIKIIGFHDINDPESYQGEDFYSRHDNVMRFMHDDQLPENTKTELTEPSNIDTKDSIIIDLHNSKNWKKYLIGNPLLHGNEAHLSEGALIKAIKINKNKVIILNPPIESEDFNIFMEEVNRHRKFAAYGKSFDLNNIEFVYSSQSYDEIFKQNDEFIKFIPNKQLNSNNTLIINSSNVRKLFRSCILTNNGINIGSGILKKNSNKELNILLSGSLKEEDWVNLYKKAKKYKVKLNISVAEDIRLPFILEDKYYYKTKTKAYNPDLMQGNQIIISKDIDYTVADICNKDSTCIPIDVSELTSSDLIYSVDNKFNLLDKENKFRFNKSEGALIEALKAGKHIILHGEFSTDLANSLHSLFTNPPYIEINGERIAFAGKITLVNKEKEKFPFCDIVIHEKITHNDKVNLLKEKYSKEICDKIAKNFTSYGADYASLESHARMLKHNINSNYNDGWQGLSTVPKRWHDKVNTEINFRNAKNKTEEFDSDRLKLIENTLMALPYVFIAGKTGIGKTSFINDILKKQKDKYNIHFGENNIEKWISDNSEKTKLLFIDESNLTSSDFSIFEGLFNNPPTIVFNKKIYTLSNDHKVVFAGNPLSYGDRKLASLVAKHGGSVVFHELPSEYIYQKILLPVFQPISDELEKKNIEDISKKILDIYQKIVSISEDTVLISPRELQMMAISIAADREYAMAKNQKYLDENLYRSIYCYTESLIPEKEKKDFDSLFNTKLTWNIEKDEVDNLRNNGFTLTESRKTPYKQLSDFLKVRDFRTKKSRKKIFMGNMENSEAQKYGGLGGFIIEGDPGIGKSEFITSILSSKGFTKRNIDDNSAKQNAWYHIPVSLSIAEKEKILIKAFNEGAVVLIDEINSQPMIERLLNALLSGKDLEGRTPKKEGFIFIGTQNPIYMHGRKDASNALKRRILKIELPEYTREEIVKLGSELYPNVNKQLLELNAQKYCEAVHYAKNKQVKIPTLRSFLRFLNEENKISKHRFSEERRVRKNLNQTGKEQYREHESHGQIEKERHKVRREKHIGFVNRTKY